MLILRCIIMLISSYEDDDAEDMMFGDVSFIVVCVNYSICCHIIIYIIQ